MTTPASRRGSSIVNPHLDTSEEDVADTRTKLWSVVADEHPQVKSEDYINAVRLALGKKRLATHAQKKTP